jgi:tetratricopeptide (TPR) repeat protein
MTEKHCHDADSLHRLGVSAYQENDFETALKLVLEAIKIDSKPEYYNTFGVILSEAGNEQGAIKAYRKAIELNNDYASAYCNLGNCLQKQNKYAESIEYYEQAISISPDYPDAYNGLAVSLYRLGNYDDAIKNCRKAIELKEDYAQAYNTLAAVLEMLQMYDEAIECYNKTVEYAPDYVEAYCSRGILHLRHGQFAKGWDDYQWRLKTEKVKGTLQYDKPWWQGEDFQGKTLLVQSEQGFGDSMQFVRYLPMVKDRGGTVILAEKSELIDLFRNLEGIDDIVDIRQLATGGVKYDLYAPLLNLPCIFNTDIDSIPARIPYLFADESKVTHWRGTIGTDAFNVGIVWAGDPIHTNDHNRSCTIDNFTGLAKLENVKIFSLQKGPQLDQIKDWPSDIEQIGDLGQKFNDFSDTAAAIENMDLIISVDTSVIHLAGAMGKTAWLVIPYESDWRWMLNRQDSPWYSTVRIFRQIQPGDWDDVFQRVAEQLKILIEKQMVTNNLI